MKLTKFLHACVLVESDSTAVLFDPGVYSYESGVVKIENLPKIDYIVITHEHADHCHPPFIKEVTNRFPELIILTNPEVDKQLGGDIGAKVLTSLPEPFQQFTAPHESLPAGPAPANIGVHFAGEFTHPGDSYSFNETKRILAMPMTAPWGSMTASIKKIIELKPEVVLPIHDWHYRPEALGSFYERFKDILSAQNINFIIPKDGQAVEV